MASETVTIKLKPVHRNSGLVINGHQYRLKAGQTEITLSVNDAETFRVVYPMLIQEINNGLDISYRAAKYNAEGQEALKAKKKAAPDVGADEAKDS